MKATFAGCAITVFFAGCIGLEPASVPSHPQKLDLKPREFELPKADDHRVLLWQKVPAYIGEDRSAPTFRVTLLFETGIWFDPEGKEGLSEAAANLLRYGGTEDLTPSELDFKLESKAIRVKVRSTQDSFRIQLWSLQRSSRTALELLSEIIRRPRFSDNRLQVWKRRKLQSLGALHDRPDQILRLYWRDLIWGEKHVVGRRPTRSSVQSIDREDLLAWHKRWIRPGNCLIVATSKQGRVFTRNLIENELDQWEGKEPGRPEFEPPPAQKPPGVYLFNKDLAQGAVRLGHRGIRYGDKDYHALKVVSRAFGGGSFRSRLTQRIRVTEGMTYSIHSYVIPGWIFPGTTMVQFSSESRNVARAIGLVEKEITGLWKDGLTEAELAGTKQAMISRFAGFFEDLHDSLLGLALLEYRDRPLDFFLTYRERIKAITLAQANRAAKRFLKPGELRILVAGNSEEIREGAEASGLQLEDFGPVEALQKRDPMK